MPVTKFVPGGAVQRGALERSSLIARQFEGQPAEFTSRALIDSDDGNTLICASPQIATVNVGLPDGFGCAFNGPISFNGTATIRFDQRTTGQASPWCFLVQVSPGVYDVLGRTA